MAARMNYDIRTIPHAAQRYETVGDYCLDSTGFTHVRISDMGNEDYEFLVAIHELIEEHLTRKRGITEESIKAFDEAYEANRHPEDTTSEPGWAENAPYRKEHAFSEWIERQIANELGVDWESYSEKVESL
jgi:hypothetical protein